MRWEETEESESKKRGASKTSEPFGELKKGGRRGFGEEEEDEGWRAVVLLGFSESNGPCSFLLQLITMESGQGRISGLLILPHH